MSDIDLTDEQLEALTNPNTETNAPSIETKGVEVKEDKPAKNNYNVNVPKQNPRLSSFDFLEPASFGPMAKLIYSSMMNYVETMNSGEANKPHVRIHMQTTLYRQFLSAINMRANDIKDYDNALVCIVHLIRKHRAECFNDRRIYVGFDAIPLAKSEIDTFKKLINLFRIIADTNPAKNISMLVNIDKTLETFSTDKAERFKEWLKRYEFLPE